MTNEAGDDLKREERWRAADEEQRKRDAIEDRRERLRKYVYDGDISEYLKKQSRRDSWHGWMVIGTYGVLCVLLALMLSEVASRFFAANPPWWKMFGAIVLTLLATRICHWAIESASVAIAWRLGGKKLRLMRLVEWMMLNDMPPRSEAMLWAKEFNPDSAEQLTQGYFYLYWLSQGRFGSSPQIQAAVEYIAAYEKLGWFEQDREKDVVRDATIRYFALLSQYFPAEKCA